MLLVCFCTLLSGCGKKASVANSQFLGEWETEIDTGSSGGNFVLGIASSLLEKYTGATMQTYSIKFQSDGSVKMYLGGTLVTSGTFTVSEDDQFAYAEGKDENGNTSTMTFTYNDTYISSDGTNFFKK
jgi:hypothetical protein